MFLSRNWRDVGLVSSKREVKILSFVHILNMVSRSQLTMERVLFLFRVVVGEVVVGLELDSRVSHVVGAVSLHTVFVGAAVVLLRRKWNPIQNPIFI